MASLVEGMINLRGAHRGNLKIFEKMQGFLMMRNPCLVYINVESKALRNDHAKHFYGVYNSIVAVLIDKWHETKEDNTGNAKP